MAEDSGYASQSSNSSHPSRRPILGPSNHVVLGPLTSEGGGIGVESGQLIQWNPEEYFDNKISYAMGYGCLFDWKSRLRKKNCLRFAWEWAKANKREFMAAITVTLTLVCMRCRSQRCPRYARKTDDETIVKVLLVD